MKTDQQRCVTRRQFLITAICAGGAAIIGAGLFGRWPHGDKKSAALFRNPAYNLRRDPEGAVLVCQTSKGQAKAFRVDEPAALFWKHVPTAEAFVKEGKRVTTDAVLDAIAPKFKGQSESEWRQDAKKFVKEALEQGVLLTDGAKVKIAYTPPIKGA